MLSEHQRSFWVISCFMTVLWLSASDFCLVGKMFFEFCEFVKSEMFYKDEFWKLCCGWTNAMCIYLFTRYLIHKLMWPSFYLLQSSLCYVEVCKLKVLYFWNTVFSATWASSLKKSTCLSWPKCSTSKSKANKIIVSELVCNLGFW